MIEQVSMMKATPDLNLPWDLSEWAGMVQLCAWVEEGVGGLDWGNPELGTWLQAHPDVQPQVLLSVLTLAYALGMYDAEEIENACYNQPAFQNLRGKFPPPRAAQLSRFRRENRGLLKYCLFELFKRAFKERFETTGALIPAGIRKHLLESSVARLDIARQMGRGSDSL
ncbi:MAG: hypothetical protein JWM16_1666 [Verrucomicrobiales bacterium]|nr:hypothetical protein [Verrucomicrobiales bacterium]